MAESPEDLAPGLAEAMSARAGFAAVAAALAAAPRAQVRVLGADGALGAMLAARLAATLPEARRPLVVITAGDDEAQTMARDLRFFLRDPVASGEEPLMTPRVEALPQLETTPWADVAPDRRASARRMATLFRLSQGVLPEVLVASAAALMHRVVPRAAFSDLVDVVEAQQALDRDRFVALLVGGGYSRMPVVEDAGTFAVRGGVVDVFVPLYRFPFRIELDGDAVESLRFFDPETQRTMRAVEQVYVHPVRETVLTAGHRLRERLLEAGDHAAHPSSKTRALIEQIEKGEEFFGQEALAPAFHATMASLAEYLPAQPVFLVDDPDAVRARVDEVFSDGDAACAARLEQHRLAFPAADFYLDGEQVTGFLGSGARVETHLLEIQNESTAPTIRFRSETHRELVAELARSRAEKHEELLGPLARRLRHFRDESTRALIAVPSAREAERVEALLRGYQIVPRLVAGEVDLLDERAQRTNVEIVVGALARGFHLPLDNVALIAEAEIFGEKAVRTAAKKAKGGLRPDGLKNLELGAYVVHTLHGVGIYKGLTKLPLRSAGREIAVDFLQLEYDGGGLYLPVWRINEVQAYSGAEGLKPRLDKLGGQTWDKTRNKVKRELRALAEELLQLYAQRRSLPGTSLALKAHDEQVFREFEATFPFEETPDQQRAIDDVLADLDKQSPMDRLVCGDVGYGKTEVALRAALKAALAGKQVAFLAPTTVLVEQHALTMKTRFTGLPVKLASVSRFSDKAELQASLREISDGRLDIVVGTHRLLSTDVRWKDLGLVIVDEEQRFGVVHKEKLKKLKSQVDVLTMSATPIPRTLHMAMMGLRDLSVITTPPADRLAIRTLVARDSDALIVEGVQRELARGGQIFFVHNRVEDIDEVAGRLRRLLPSVRMLVGHGQMASEELERVMLDFVDGKANLLICTTIIESGIDIPRANTMFVDRADCFGLAQLYQLRGRIGRSRERAYCYLLLPTSEAALSADAKARLAVLQRFSELGAGFQIASHDLELRGAGDLLGAKQSGVIAAVGFETYTQLLEEAVASLRGETIHEATDPDITCDLPGFIPDDYLPDVGQRLEFYRRLSAALDGGEIREILSEIADRYGPVPTEVDVLGGIMILKSLARRLGARGLEIVSTSDGGRLTVALPTDDAGKNTPLKPEHVIRLVSARPSSKTAAWKLTPDMRLARSFASANEPLSRLTAARELLDELLSLS